ncbi:AMP-binding protein [Tomitella fengzijianii]|uniref:AMP-binding protein n=2 Tax=Tomitella fengzijianii TaxID=2597660 RepID=A0A516X776_9ACTN|nr:AMP-binding protein [Tomitella fengzijianii]
MHTTSESARHSAHIDTFCRDNLPPADQWPTFEFTLPELQYPDRINCATALLDDVIALHGPDRPCLSGGGESWTYGETLAHANRIAHVLVEDLGLVPGGRVLLRGFNNPWMAACWLGVLKAGGVVVTTMPLLRGKEIRGLIDLTRAGIALCDHRLAEGMSAAADGVTVVYFGGAGPDDLVARASTKPAQFDDVPTAADDVAMLAPTSGTTGVPKATMQFHRDVLAVCDTFSKHVLQPTEDDVFTGTPPLGFTFGLGGALLFPLRVGASSILLEHPDQDAIADAIMHGGATILFTAPTAYRSMLRSGHESVLGRLRRGVSAGEALPGAVWQEVRDRTGLALIDGIGATEMMHVFISAADENIRPGATGRVVPGYRAEVLDSSGRPAPDGEPGRLAVIGPTGCRYLADPRQAQYVHDGWNITGDTYIRDADGYFWFQARSDDMIVSSGYNIAGPAVEQALGQHPDVVECAVIGIPDEARGAVVHAAVVLRDGVAGDDAKRSELQRFVKDAIAPYKYPRSLEFRASLPKTPTGKLQRYRLREQIAEQGR